MNPLETRLLDCPWCAAPLEIEVDISSGNQTYVEDCQVCCSPMVVTLRIGEDPEDELRVTLVREGD